MYPVSEENTAHRSVNDVCMIRVVCVLTLPTGEAAVVCLAETLEPFRFVRVYPQNLTNWTLARGNCFTKIRGYLLKNEGDLTKFENWMIWKSCVVVIN